MDHPIEYRHRLVKCYLSKLRNDIFDVLAFSFLAVQNYYVRSLLLGIPTYF